MNLAETKKLLFSMTTIWPNFNIDDSTPRVYEVLLSDVEYSAADKALLVIGRRSKFAPSPAEIIEAVSEMSGNKRMSANEAWAMVLNIGLSVYTPPARLAELPKEVQQALRNAGSYYNLARGDLEQARKSFMSAWNALGDTEHREQVQRIGSGLKRIGTDQ